ncbi:PREDICTED: probable DNA mismatch repair protein Msh6 [Nicrophorus vespilloides]|uniref:Probable DNA mismatch repair protein Msh6 n=1 Tax=Nicrophorus vespilloides TaxID=110193 RepID=A0ABM1NAK7_NICVS|nr:PREDICTED: probable DNA mismatch repair protein Msh6 [Nicrophorus vespilloides]
MSKRLSSSQSNTLLNYFQSPKGKAKKPNVSSPVLIPKNQNEDSDEDVIKPKKRNRIAIVDSDSDNENIDSPKRNPSKKTKVDENSSALKKFNYEKTNTPIKDKLQTSKLPITSTKPITNDETRWLHENLEFLKPANRRDINKNKVGDPNYDQNTLYIPDSYLNTLTPAMRQWWVLKSKHMDSVLFFKVGKFYELYHMDATVGVEHLGFSYMKGEFAHSGFPESAYGKMASSLIEQGFKVARVEQTETPAMMAERCKVGKATKFDKVVKREICQISLKGSCIYGAQLTEAQQVVPYYMTSICEKFIDNQKHFGVCFVDTSIGTFHLTNFQDDKHCSRLLALLAQHPPVLVLTERNQMSSDSNEILKRSLGIIRRDNLTSGTQFLSAETAVKMLGSERYFRNSNDDLVWPSLFDELLTDRYPKPEYELALKALGACIWYLKDCEMDIQVISMGQFELYTPVDTLQKSHEVKRDYMILDSITINNLKLFGGEGSLQKTLDYCSTPFGKRFFQQWICKPLCDVNKIESRQNTVKELYNDVELLRNTKEILCKLPDLERQIAKIHMFGNKFCSTNHPDSRAVFYEAKIYANRKITDLLTTLQAFEKLTEIPKIFSSCESQLLKRLTRHAPEGNFYDTVPTLNFFKDAFDHKKAKEEGKIIPQKGVDQEYDEAEEKITGINQLLEEYLDEQRSFFKCEVNYFGADKKRFQLEIPESRCSKVTHEYQLEGTKKGSKPCKRYSTATSKDLLAKMMEAENDRNKILLDLNRRIFEKFSEKYEQWEKVIKCVTVLDCLCSLAEYARNYSEDICLPKLLPFTDKPICIIENGRHPCIKNVDNFVPNDTEMGSENHAPILILTGPNMGGKSTLMRQTVLIAIMAQIGSYVPAINCELSLVDRIFTRLGAYDDILKNQSTFMVELSEASSILQHATKHSFLLLDELGRGTSTHDGNAIASAYIRKLCDINCRTMFSTHYHTLVDYFAGKNDIQLGYMVCMVENEGDVKKECVTFLYKMAAGVCPKSYGFNVAKLAGVPSIIVKRATELAAALETADKNKNLLKKLLSSSLKDSRSLLMTLG